MKELLRFMWPK